MYREYLASLDSALARVCDGPPPDMLASARVDECDSTGRDGFATLLGVGQAGRMGYNCSDPPTEIQVYHTLGTERQNLRYDIYKIETF